MIDVIWRRLNECEIVCLQMCNSNQFDPIISSLSARPVWLEGVYLKALPYTEEPSFLSTYSVGCQRFLFSFLYFGTSINLLQKDSTIIMFSFKIFFFLSFCNFFLRSLKLRDLEIHGFWVWEKPVQLKNYTTSVAQQSDNLRLLQHKNI